MDQVYRKQRHFYDLTRKFFLFGRDRLIAGLDIPDGARVLEVGCGTGRNLVIAARKNPQVLFYGIDISSEMLQSAEAAATRAGVGDRVFLAQANAESLDARSVFGVAGFERVILSYSLSMMPDWRNALAAAAAQMSPHGNLHIVDFGKMELWPAFAVTAMRRWLARHHVTPRDELIAELLELEVGSPPGVRTKRILGGYARVIVFSGHGPT